MGVFTVGNKLSVPHIQVTFNKGAAPTCNTNFKPNLIFVSADSSYFLMSKRLVDSFTLDKAEAVK